MHILYIMHIMPCNDPLEFGNFAAVNFIYLLQGEVAMSGQMTQMLTDICMLYIRVGQSHSNWL